MRQGCVWWRARWWRSTGRITAGGRLWNPASAGKPLWRVWWRYPTFRLQPAHGAELSTATARAIARTQAARRTHRWHRRAGGGRDGRVYRRRTLRASRTGTDDDWRSLKYSRNTYTRRDLRRHICVERRWMVSGSWRMLLGERRLPCGEGLSVLRACWDASRCRCFLLCSRSVALRTMATGLCSGAWLLETFTDF